MGNSYFTSVYDENADPELLKLDTDTCLFGDEGFRPHAIKYAEDQDAFFKDYAAVHKKLSELGSDWEAEVSKFETIRKDSISALKSLKGSFFLEISKCSLSVLLSCVHYFYFRCSWII